MLEHGEGTALIEAYMPSDLAQHGFRSLESKTQTASIASEDRPIILAMFGARKADAAHVRHRCGLLAAFVIRCHGTTRLADAGTVPRQWSIKQRPQRAWVAKYADEGLLVALRLIVSTSNATPSAFRLSEGWALAPNT
ncbi:hypothetical protein L1887_60665 [Cichorium endivia]|nr:hypothetical protein L1887_60665 [Cichorium endivia]